MHIVRRTHVNRTTDVNFLRGKGFYKPGRFFNLFGGRCLQGLNFVVALLCEFPRTYLFIYMSDFPKWLLALAGLSLIPVLLCPLFLFGGQHPFGQGGNALTSFLLYLLTQLLWLIPAVFFFVSLDVWRRGFGRAGVALAVLGAALSAGGFFLLLHN